MDDGGSGAQTVTRACAILKLISEVSPAGMRASDVAARMGLPRATIYRVLTALQGSGMIELGESGRYVLGVDMFLMGLRAQNRDSVREVVRATLLRLSSATGDTAFLLLRHGFDAICIDRVDGNYPIQAPMKNIGERLPVGQVPAGMMILAMLPEAEQDEVIRHNLHRIVSDELPDEVAVRAAMRETRERQYAINQGQGLSTLGGVAVSISNAAGHVVGAISIGGIAQRFSDSRISQILHVIRQESKRLGPLTYLLDDGGALPLTR